MLAILTTDRELQVGIQHLPNVSAPEREWPQHAARAGRCGRVKVGHRGSWSRELLLCNRVRGTPDGCIRWEFMGVCDVLYWLRAESTSGGSGVRYIAGDGEQNAGFAVPPRVPAPAVRRPKLGLEWGDRRDSRSHALRASHPGALGDGKLEQFNVDQVFARLQNGESPTSVPTVTWLQIFQC
jgi:hypothetical protein